jgi:protein-arginine kinase activator protein McsA
MKKAASELEYEQAAELRDRIRLLEEERVKLG